MDTQRELAIECTSSVASISLGASAPSRTDVTDVTDANPYPTDMDSMLSEGIQLSIVNLITTWHFYMTDVPHWITSLF